MTLAVASVRQPNGSLKTELARANPCFGVKKRPVFSNVSIEGEVLKRNGEVERATWFAQLRLLFSCVDHKGKRRAYAFVKWYQKTGPHDLTGAIRLKWEQVRCSATGGAQRDRYNVIGIQKVKKLEHILPDPNEKGLFYVNPFRVV
jgi:hypothetical protein